MTQKLDFSDRLLGAHERIGLRTGLCVGLDPVWDRLPAELRAGGIPKSEAIERFSLGVIGAIQGVVSVVKFQSACYERYGSAGIGVLERVIPAAVARGLMVILDAKRGDIGPSAEHYAAAAVALGAHAITVSGYLGLETVEPYLAAGLGVFVLVRTSNPGGDQVQTAALATGESIAGMMAARVREFGDRYPGSRGWSHVGAVVGATKAAEGAGLRKAMPRQVLLIPGYGAQGGTAADIRTIRGESSGHGLLVTASRSVTYPTVGGSQLWTDAVRDATRGFKNEIDSI